MACHILGVSQGEKGYAALPGREDDFKASLSKAIEYAVALRCPRQVSMCNYYSHCHTMPCPVN